VLDGEDQWYGVRSVARFARGEGGTYEERVTLWRARSFEQAGELARQEARRHAGQFQAEFLDYSDSYLIDKEIFELDAEVFSCLQVSSLSPQAYIDTLFSVGRVVPARISASNGDGAGLAWYGVRCLYHWVDWDDRPFEERITLWRAVSGDRAVELAEEEAAQYTEDSGIEYLGFSQVYGPCEGDEVVEGMVVFALSRDSDLPPEAYIEKFFGMVRERGRADSE
jgi:hypothetical protein